MIALFKDRSPVTILWLLLLSVAVHFHFFLVPPQVVANEADGLFSMFLQRYVAPLPSVAIMLLYLLLVITQALRLNFLFNDHRMFIRPTFLTAMVYLLITAIFPQWNQLTPALVANTLVVWLFSLLVKLYNSPNPKSLLYNIGLIIGGCILMYHPTSLLVLLALFALMVVRPFDITELLVMFMGVLTPFYFLLSYLFLTDKWNLLSGFIPDFQLNLPDVEANALFFVSIGIVLFILVVGVFYFQDRSRRMLIQVRKNWGVLLVMLLIMLPLPFISENASLDSLLLWVIPVSPFMAMGFLSPKKETFPNLMFWLLFGVIVANNVMVFRK